MCHIVLLCSTLAHEKQSLIYNMSTRSFSCNPTVWR